MCIRTGLLLAVMYSGEHERLTYVLYLYKVGWGDTWLATARATTFCDEQTSRLCANMFAYCVHIVFAGLLALHNIVEHIFIFKYFVLLYIYSLSLDKYFNHIDMYITSKFSFYVYTSTACVSFLVFAAYVGSDGVWCFYVMFCILSAWNLISAHYWDNLYLGQRRRVWMVCDYNKVGQMADRKYPIETKWLCTLNHLEKRNVHLSATPHLHFENAKQC